MRPLLEREAEIDELTALIQRAAVGHGALAVIVGAAGVGKTSLVDEARGIAEEHGFRSLFAVAGELEASFAFGVARNLFERLLAGLPDRERAGLLQGAARLAAPVLSLEEAGDPAGAPRPPDPAFAALHGLYWLSVNLSQRSPLLLAVDDAHWADAASLRFLAYMAQRVDELPVLLLVAARPPHPGPEGELLDALVSPAVARHVLPRPLTEAATAELLAVGLNAEPATEFTRAFHQATGGNPFLITSLIATLRDAQVEPTTAAAPELERLRPRDVGRSVDARLRRLPAASTSLARAVAVVGPAVELRLAARLAGLDRREASEAADALARQQILRDGRPLEFVHPIVRTAVYEALPHGERALAHARAARLLHADGAPPDLLAPHLLAADPAADAWVVEQLRAAASSAMGRGAPEAAAEHLRRALREPPAAAARPNLLRELGAAEYMVGDRSGVDRLREALESMATPVSRGHIARDLTRALLPIGRFTEAVETLEAAIAALGVDDRELTLELEAELATAGRLDPSTQPATAARLERVAERIDGRTPSERLIAASLAFQRALAGGPAAEAATLAELALEGGLLAEQGPDSPAFADVSVALIMAERYERLQRELDDALVDSRARGSLIGFAVASAFRSLLAQRRGALGEAVGEARAAIDAAGQAGWTALQPMALAFLIEALVDRGQIDAAQDALSPYAGVEIPDNLMLNFLHHARARAYLEAGELEPGLAELTELARREGALGWDNPSRFPHRSEAAVARARLGEHEAARRLAREELDLARAWGTPRATGVALRAAGLVARDEHRVELLRESVEVLARSEAELEHARALIDLGAALRRAGNRKDSREPLASGMEIAHRCGATLIAQRAREELLSSGARPRRMVRTGIDALTPSELRVARMAGDGMSNREIAQALFVTMRTVEVHLTSAYRKLDIASRDELPTGLKRA